MAEVRINTTGKLSLFDADDSHAASIVAGTVTANENVMSLATAGVTFNVPTITLGDATAEDTKLVFDGNAQDFYIGLDDSADDLLIGLGSTVGTTPAISIDENLAVKTYGDITMTGTTPTLTIGDAGAEDTKIVFDGNAQDFYIGLDDSADDLVIGVGSAVGTTPAIHIDENKKVTVGESGIVSSIAGVNVLLEANSIFIGDDVTGTTDTAANSVAVGIDALDAVTTGDANVALGKSALSGLQDGANNIAIGNQAGVAITSAGDNIAIGSNALQASVTGARNIAIGSSALVAHAENGNTYNLAIGYDAGKTITTGLYNMLIGHLAGDGFDTENHNLAVGLGALGGPVAGGEYNVAVGNYALDAVQSGDSNTACGYAAGSGIVEGSYNTCIGESAGGSITDGEGNVCIGQNSGNAGVSLTTGDNNILIGEKISAGTAGNDNQIVIGSEGTTGKGSNTGFISPNGGAMYQGDNATAWTQTSDERVKKNIKDYDKGLNEINKLKIRTFDYRRLNEMPLGKNDLPLEDNEMPESNQVGLIAQEMIDVFPNTIIENPDNGRLSLQPDEIHWALIKAVQELTARLEALENK